MRFMRRLIVAAWVFASGMSVAADIGTTYPAGCISTREQAQEALVAARAAANEAEAAHRAELQRCAGVFLQTQCTQAAKRKFDAQKREIRRIEVEAREVRRRLDADERAAKKSAAESKPKSDGTSSAPTDAAARAAEQAEKDKAAAVNREQYMQRQKEHQEEQARRNQKEAAEANERETNVKEYDEKQRAAALYAKRKEAERLDNEKRREQRRIERERKQKELEDQAKP